MQFEMPVLLVGGMSFQPETGGRINQLYVLNSDPSSGMYRGFVPAKMSCEQSVFDSLPTDPASYPIQATLTVINRTQGGKTVQFALGIVQKNLPKKAAV